MSTNTERGTGKTTAQMLSAPQKCVYIWCNDSLHYPKALAGFLNRSDLKIVGLSNLRNRICFDGLAGQPILDHAALEHDMITLQQLRTWNELQDYWRIRNAH